MRAKWLGLLAVFLGLLAAGGVYSYLGSLERKLEAGKDLAPVLVARQDIPFRTRLTPDLLEVRQIPRGTRLEGALQEPGAAVGLLATATIYKGEQVLRSRLAGGATASGNLSYRVEPGRRGITLAVDKATGLAGLVKAGDRVDVVAVLDLPLAGGQKDFVATMIVQDVRVLAVGQKMDESSKEAASKEVVPDKEGTVTLEVAPAEAQGIALAAEKGKLRLALRPPDERGKNALPPVRLNGLAATER